MKAKQNTKHRYPVSSRQFLEGLLFKKQKQTKQKKQTNNKKKKKKKKKNTRICQFAISFRYKM